MDNTKTLKDGLHIVVGDFEWKIAYEDKTDILVSGGNWNRDGPKEESRSLKEIVPMFSGKASIFCASRALSNCGATSDIPRFFWISNGKCSATLLPKAISAKLKVKRFKRSTLLA